MISGDVTADDYRLSSDEVFIGVGARTAMVSLTASDDDLPEGAEQFVLRLVSVSSGVTVAVGRIVTVTIPENDQPPVVPGVIVVTPTITPSVTTLNEGESEQLVIELEAAAPVDVTLTLKLEVISGDVTADDYRLSSDEVFIGVGARTAMVSLTASDDDLPEGAEQFVLRLVSVSSGVTVAVGRIVTVTIPENDQPPVVPGVIVVTPTITPSVTTLNEGESEQLVIELEAAAPVGVTLTFALEVISGDVTADDYRLSSDEVFIGVGARTAMVSLTASDDDLPEGAEQFVLRLVSVSSGVTVAVGRIVTVTIPENDQPPVVPGVIVVTPTITPSVTTLNEGESEQLVIELEAAAPVDVTLTLKLEVISGDVTADDYRLSSDEVFIGVGARTAMVSLTASDDDLPEGAEQFVLRLVSVSSGVTVAVGRIVTVTIPENDQPPVVPGVIVVTPTITPSVTTLNEGESEQLVIELEAAAPVDVTLTLKLEVISGDVTADDYRLSSDEVFIGVGARTAMVSLTASDDDLPEGAEQFVLRLVSVSSGVTVAVGRIVTVTIPENDQPPVVPGVIVVTPTITPSVTTLNEGESEQLVIELEAAAPVDVTLTLKLEVISGDVTADDYRLSSDEVFIGVGARTAMVSLTASDDDLPEGAEQFVLRLTSVSSGVTVAVGRIVTVTIPENDQPPVVPGVIVVTPTITPSVTTLNEGESEQLVIELEAAAPVDVTLTLKLEVISGDVTADDYRLSSDEVFIGVGARTAMVSLTASDDDLPEGAEQFVLRLVSVSSGVTVAVGRIVTVTIPENDQPPVVPGVIVVTPTITPSVTTLNEGESEQLVIELEAAAPVDVTLTLKLEVISGDVTADDYRLSSDEVFIGVGARTAMVSLTASDDDLPEGAEQFVLRLTSVSSGVTVAVGRIVTVTIPENDQPPVAPEVIVVTPTITPSVTTLNEGESEQLVIELEAAAPVDVTLTLKLEVISGDVTADDYRLSSDEVFIGVGARTAMVSLTASDDDLPEGAEQFVLRLVSVSSGVTVAVGRIVTVTIPENDQPPVVPGVIVVTPTITPSVTTLNEGESEQLVIELEAAAPVGVTLTFALEVISGDVTADDYRLSSDEVFIGVGARTAMVSLTASDDDLPEGAEQFVLRLTSVSSGVTVAVGRIVTVTIPENDQPPVVPEVIVVTPTITPDMTTLAEDESVDLEIELEVAAPVGVTLTFALEVISGDVTADDYRLSSDEVFIGVGARTAMVSLTASDDDLPEGAEQFVLRLTSVSSGVTVAVGRIVTVTIPENDQPPVVPGVIVVTPTITPDMTTLAEDESVDLEIELEVAAPVGVTLTFALEVISGDVTADDYRLSSDEVFIGVGARTAMVSLTASDDDLPEGAEQFVLRLVSVSSGVTVAVGRIVTVTIPENDQPPVVPEVIVVTPTITPDMTTLAEDESVDLEIELEVAAPVGVTLTFALEVISGDVTADDYRLSSDEVFIGVGARTAMVSLTAYDDALLEGAEQFVLRLTSVSSGVTVAVGRIVTVTIPENDQPPVVPEVIVVTPTITPDMTTLAEDESVDLEIELEVAAPVGVTLTFALEVISGDVTADDYRLSSDEVFIGVGARTAMVSLTAYDDALLEGAEQFVLRLVSVSSGVTVAVGRIVTVTIPENDQPPVVPEVIVVTPTITPDMTTLAEDESVDLEIELEVAAPVGVTLTFALEVISGDVTADDYRLSSDEVFIGVGARTAMVSLTAYDDALLEGAEQFVLRLVSVSSGVTVAVGRIVTVTIPENDQPPVVPEVIVVTPTITPDMTTLAEDESVDLEIELEVAAPVGVTLTFALEVISGDVTADDYRLSSDEVFIGVGARTAMVSLTASDDDLPEGAEQFVLRLVSVSSGVTVAVGRIVTVTIPENDQPPVVPGVIVVTPTITPSVTTLNEGESEQLVIELEAAAPVDVTLTLKLEVISGDVTADDYRLSSDEVFIGVGARTAMVSLTASDDDLPEGAEQFVLRLTSVSSGVTVAVGRIVTVTIPANDQPPAAPEVIVVTPTITPDMTTLAEDESVDLEIELEAAAPVGVTLTFALEVISGDVTADDYRLSSDEVFIGVGARTAMVSLTAYDDNLPEGAEQFVLRLVSVSSGVTVAVGRIVTVTIPENDQPPVVPGVIVVTPTITPSVTTLNEGESEQLVIELEAAAPVGVTLTFALEVISGDVTADDYRLSSDEVFIGVGARTAMVSLTAYDDALLEGAEQFVLRLTSVSSGVTVAVGRIVTVTIPANDQPLPPPEATHIEFVVLTATINEGDMYDIELRLVDSKGILRTHSDDVVVTLDVYGHGTDSLTGYTFSSMVTIPAGQITGVSRFISVDDTDVESDERVTLQISAVTMVSSSPLPGRDSRDMFTITVRDDDAEIGFDQDMYTVDEDAGGVTITIDIDGRLTEDVTLNYEIDPGTASETEDYVAPLTREIPLSSGATSATLFVEIMNDDLYENADTFSVRLVEPASGLPSGVELATGSAEADVTITNDDEIEIGFVEGMYTFLENQRRGTAQVRYSGSEIAPGVTVTVSYATTVVIGDSIDINDVSGMLMLISGQRVYNINFPITDDNAFNRATERYTVSLETLDMNSGLTFRLDRVSASLNVLTDDVLDFGFSVTEYEVNEDAGTVELEVGVLRNTIGAGESVIVRYSTTPGSATSADFEPVMMGEVTLSSMSTVARFTIQITDDNILENSESFVVTLTKADGRDTLQLLQSKATVTILDDDDPVTIGFGRASYSVTEGAGAVVDLDVGVLSGGLERDITLEYDIRGGSAIAGTDYEYMTGTVTLSSDASESISIVILDDDRFELGEIFTVVLTDHDGPSYVTLDPASAIVMITDNEDAPTVVFNTDLSMVAEGGSANVVVELDGDSHGSDVVVSFTIGGTATPGTDFTAPMTTVTIPAGDSSAMIRFNIDADQRYEGADETVVLTLTSATGDVTVGTPSVHTVTITDAETAPTVIFNTDSSMVAEGGSANVVVELDGDLHASDVVVSFTIGGTATPGTDFTAPMTTVTIPTGDSSAMITFNIDADQRYEGAADTVVLTLTSATGDVTVGPPSVHTVTITDAETAPTVVFNTDSSMSDEGTTANVLVELDGDLHASDVVVSFTIGGTAVVGDDYSSLANSVTILAGDSSAMITFNIDADQRYEGAADTVVLTLTSATGDVTVGTPSIHTVTITDAETAPTVVFNIDSSTSDEGTTANVLVELDGDLHESDVVVSFTVGGTAVVGDDYTSLGSSVTIPAGDRSAMITFNIEDNQHYDDTLKTVVLTLASATGDVTVGTPSVHTVTIEDDESLPTLVIEGVKRLEEGNSAIITVRLDGAPLAKNITVSLTRVGDSSTVGANDYELVALDDVILAGETTAAFRLTAKLSLTADMRDITEIDEMLALIARVPDFEDSALHVVTIPGIAGAIVRPDDTFDACKLAPSGVQACVDGEENTYGEPLLVVIEKAAPGFVPVELPPETTYLKIDLLWNIYFVKEAGQQVDVSSLKRNVEVQFTAPRDVVDANGGPDSIAVAVLHAGESEWEVLETNYKPDSSGKYRFYADIDRFSHFTLIVQPETEDDDYFALPPTGGLALPLWLVAVLLLTGLTLVVGTVYVVRRPRSAPRG